MSVVGLQRRQHQTWGEWLGARPIRGDVGLPGERGAEAPQGVLEPLRPGFHARRVDVCSRLRPPSSRRRGGGAHPPPVDRLLHRGTQRLRSVRLPGDGFLARSTPTPLRPDRPGFAAVWVPRPGQRVASVTGIQTPSPRFRFAWVRTPFVPSLRATPKLFLGVLVPRPTTCPSRHFVRWRAVPRRAHSSTIR